MIPYTAFSKKNQLSTGPPSNPRVFHLHVNNHCTSQEVDTCALVKVVTMKSWCHIWKYIKSTLHICVNGENWTSKSEKMWARKKILVWNIWNYNRLSSFSLVNYRCDTLNNTYNVVWRDAPNPDMPSLPSFRCSALLKQLICHRLCSTLQYMKRYLQKHCQCSLKDGC